jgi:hypothetical protein
LEVGRSDTLYSVAPSFHAGCRYIEPQQAARAAAMAVARAIVETQQAALRRSRLLLYVGRMEGFGVQGMPCTCDLGCAEEPQQAALSRSRLL